MKKVKVSKEFVLELHKEANLSLKTKIEKELPELFIPKYKENVWQTPLNKYEGKCCILVTDFENEKGYGVNYKGDWVDSLSCKSWIDSVRDCKEEEVETALIKEAKNKFPIGCKVNCVNNILSNVADHCINYDFKNNILYLNDTVKKELFNNGKWAEIISTPKDIEELITKYGKEELKKYL